MAKKTYDNSTINSFPDKFRLELPDGYRIDIDYDEDGEQIANLRGGFSFNDEGEENFEFSAAFITMNSTIENRDDLIKEGKLKDHFVPGMMMEQVAEGVMTQLQEQFGPGTRLNLYSSYPASVIMKFYKPFSIFGVTLESYIVMYLVEVTENLFFGFNTVYQNNEEGNRVFYKHLLNVIKSVRVSGKPVDIGKLTPKKLEQALDMESGDDVEALDLGVSIGINFQNGDEEISYTLNSDGSITGPDGDEVPPYETEEEENPFFDLFASLNEMNGPKISEEDSRKVIVDNKWSFRLPDGLDFLFNENHVDIIGNDTTADYVIKGLQYDGRYFFDFELRQRFEDGMSTDVDVLGCRYDNDVISGNAQQKIVKDDDDLYVDFMSKPVFFFNSMAAIRVRGEGLRSWDFTAGLKNSDEEMSARWDEVKGLMNELAESIQLLDSAKKSTKKKKAKKEDESSDPDFIIQNGVLRKYIGDKRNIVIPNGVKELADSVFSGFSKIKSVVVPEGVKKIGRRCFENCTHLKKCYLPDSLEELGGYAFVDCHELKEVYLSNKIKSLGDSTFSECFALKDVRLPKKIKEIDAFTFKNCDAFSHIVIPEGVKSIGASAFAGCDNLEYLFIPASVTDITTDFMGNHPFAGSEKLTIYTPAGSYAQRFAEEKGITYQNVSKGTVTADNTEASSKSAEAQSGSTASGTGNSGFTYANPDESLYPHYDSKSVTAGTNFLGMRIERRQSGTDYQFIHLAEDLDDDADEALRKAVSKLSDAGAAAYTLADRASEMRKVFHVSPDIFDFRNDRECELVNDLMQKAYMMSAIRSFAWTLSKYCEDKGMRPSDLSLEQIKSVISFIAEREWLNFDGNSFCKALCGTSDIHVYYIPDNTPESVKSYFSQTGSLDGLRKDLEYIHPAIEKLYEDIKENRDYSEPLESNDGVILYAWCALASAARGAFFTEDGPMMYFYSQEETEEERRQKEEERRRQLIEERAEISKKFMSAYGSCFDKKTDIQFKDKKFVFTGLKARAYALGDDTDYTKLIEDRGGLTRSQVSGVTDYLVVDPAGAGDSKIRNAIENQKKGKPVRIIHMDDFRKALGLPADAAEVVDKVSASMYTTSAETAKATPAPAPKTAVPASKKPSTSSVLTPEQQRQKDELDRQIEDLKSQAAFYSMQDLSAEDRQILAETKKGIEDLEKQVSGMSAAQDKFAEHLRQKEEQERKREEEKERKKAEILARGNADDISVDMYVILRNEKKLGKTRRGQKDFCRIYEEDFATLSKTEIIAKRKEILEKMKDPVACAAFEESFKKRSLKDRFEVSTRNYYNVSTGDFNKKYEEAIDYTADWYSRGEFKEVRSMLSDLEKDARKSIDAQLIPIDEKWTNFNTAKNDLIIAVKDLYADDTVKSESTEFFQAEVLALLAEVRLSTSGMFKMMFTLMNCFPWYWDKDITEIWEAALRNEIRDETAYGYGDKETARKALAAIKKKYPPEKDRLRRKAGEFVQKMAAVYERPDAYENPEKAIKDIMISLFKNEREFADCRRFILDTSALNRIPTLKAIFDEGIPSKTAYKEIPVSIGSEISDIKRKKIEEQRERDYISAIKAIDSPSGEKLSALIKAESILKALGNYKDSRNRLKNVSADIEAMKATRYEEAVTLYEEGTEKSLIRAIDKLDELGDYKDAPTLSKEYRGCLKKERAYQNALTAIESEDLNELKDAKSKLEGLSGFKNADELLKTCRDKIDAAQEKIYLKAIGLASEGTENSLKEAVSLMNTISSYKDADSKVKELQEVLNDERTYSNAVNLTNSREISDLIVAKGLFENLGNYKDSAIKAAACDKYVDELRENMYQEAIKAEKVYSLKSQTEAIAKYSSLGDYKDSFERKNRCNRNIEIIQEIHYLNRDIETNKQELAGLAGVFKKKERETKEALIRRKELRIAELKDKLVGKKPLAVEVTTVTATDTAYTAKMRENTSFATETEYNGTDEPRISKKDLSPGVPFILKRFLSILCFLGFVGFLLFSILFYAVIISDWGYESYNFIYIIDMIIMPDVGLFAAGLLFLGWRYFRKRTYKIKNSTRKMCFICSIITGIQFIAIFIQTNTLTIFIEFVFPNLVCAVIYYLIWRHGKTDKQ